MRKELIAVQNVAALRAQSQAFTYDGITGWWSQLPIELRTSPYAARVPDRENNALYNVAVTGGGDEHLKTIFTDYMGGPTPAVTVISRRKPVATERGSMHPHQAQPERESIDYIADSEILWKRAGSRSLALIAPGVRDQHDPILLWMKSTEILYPGQAEAHALALGRLILTPPADVPEA